MRDPRWITLATLLALAAPGCGGADNTIPVPKEEAAKVSTAPTPEKSTAGKPATKPRATAD